MHDPNDRFAGLPSALRRASEVTRLGDDVPALVARPEGDGPAPAVIWMHGRTVFKELDPGRYLRWIRAGIGAVALDLPGHGERFERSYHDPARTLDAVGQMVEEIDGVVASVRELGWVDMSRVAIGGMSAGGMATLRRLCDPHPFVGACVEGTSGDLGAMYFGNRSDDGGGHPAWPVAHDPERVHALSAIEHLGGWRAIPLLALHNELDEMVPVGAQRGFVERLRAHYVSEGEDPSAVELVTFGQSGAPSEHAGFGRHANEAKNLQVDFFRRVFDLPDANGGPDGA